MTLRRPVIGLLTLTGVYAVILLWIDARNNVFAVLPTIASTMPLLLSAAFLSIALRYVRWRWLLRRAGHRIPVAEGFGAYISGFAFTASPGKVGELLRIRYHAPMEVPAHRVLAAFVYERGCDLLCVLALSCLAGAGSYFFWVSVAFVLGLLAAVAGFAMRPQWLTAMLRMVPRRLEAFATPIVCTLRDGLSGARHWLTWKDALVSLLLGLLAWSLLGWAFANLLGALNIQVPSFDAFAIYPLAMLAGAASMVPGGLGSTEAAIVALLSHFGADLAVAAAAAVAIRIATLWFAILLGSIAILVLEARQAQ